MSDAAPNRSGRRRVSSASAALVLALSVASQVAFAQALELAGAVEAALRGPDVQIAALQWQQAEAAARVASQAVSGSVRTGASVSASDAGGARGTDVSFQSVSLQASFLVVPYGPGHDASVRAVEVAQDARDAVRASALRAVVTAAERWWSAERAVREARSADDRVGTAERTLDAVRIQVDAGTANAGALADAEIALVQARLDAAAAAVDRDAAFFDLSLTLGAPVTTLAPRDDGGPEAAVAWLAAVAPPDDAILAAAALASERVRSAERGVADALESAERARRDAGPSVSLSANLALSGDAGRVALSGGIDTRGYQPSLDLSVDPFSNAPAGTTAAVSLTVTVPFASERSAAFERLDLAAVLEQERLVQAHAQSLLELSASARTFDQAAGTLNLALDRLALRRLHLEASEARHAGGTVAPLELDRARSDVVDAEFAVDRALDAARIAQAQLALALGEHPFAALGLGTSARESFDTLVEGVVMEAP